MSRKSYITQDHNGRVVARRDLREHERINVQREIELKFADFAEHFFGETINLSLGGVCFAVPSNARLSSILESDFPLNLLLALRMPLRENKGAICCVGRMVHIQEAPSNLRLGVQFIVSCDGSDDIAEDWRGLETLLETTARNMDQYELMLSSGATAREVQSYKKCPVCNEILNAQDKICDFCGERF